MQKRTCVVKLGRGFLMCSDVLQHILMFALLNMVIPQGSGMVYAVDWMLH